MLMVLSAVCLGAGLARAEAKIAVAVAPVDGASEAGVVSQIMQAELSQSATLMLVEREQLDKALREMKLDAQGLADPATAQKLGVIIGARYFCGSSVSRTGGKSLAVVKVVDVETTLTKLAYAQLANPDDAVEAGQSLAKQVERLVAQFEQERAQRPAAAAASKAKPLPADWKRPAVMVIIREMHVRQPQLIDPAGETEIVKRLLADTFKVIDSEYVVMMKRGQEGAVPFRTLKTCTQYAASKKADLLLYGEAISELGASVGDFKGCRGRVELKAVDVKTDEVLVSDSAEGGAADLSETVAGKKAIQQAANRLADTFLYSVAEKWNAE
jgi:curli biogenesis system outer membrane secretion channel CsgG